MAVTMKFRNTVLLTMYIVCVIVTTLTGSSQGVDVNVKGMLQDAIDDVVADLKSDSSTSSKQPTASVDSTPWFPEETKAWESLKVRSTSPPFKNPAPKDPTGVVAELLGPLVKDQRAGGTMAGWFANVFQKTWQKVHVREGETPSGIGSPTSALVSPMNTQLDVMLSPFRAVEPADQAIFDLVEVHTEQGDIDYDDEPSAKTKSIESQLERGKSVLLRVERLPECSNKEQSWYGMHTKLQETLNVGVTTHLYLSGKEGSRALRIHADAYDVIVVQLSGSKEWEVCTNQSPPDSIPETQRWEKVDFDQAHLAAMHELRLHGQQKHTSRAAKRKQDVETLNKAFDSMKDAQSVPILPNRSDPTIDHVAGDYGVNTANADCTKFTLNPGDRLYMPYGTLHRAVTGTSGSRHVTVGLGQRHVTWGDIVYLVAYEYPKTSGVKCFGGPCDTKVNELLEEGLKDNFNTDAPDIFTSTAVFFGDLFPMWARDDPAHAGALYKRFVTLINGAVPELLRHKINNAGSKRDAVVAKAHAIRLVNWMARNKKAYDGAVELLNVMHIWESPVELSCASETGSCPEGSDSCE